MTICRFFHLGAWPALLQACISTSMHWRRRVLLRCFKSCSHTLRFPVSKLRKHFCIQVWVLCSSDLFCFVIENKSVSYSTAFSFPNAVLIAWVPCYVSSLPFRIWFTAAKSLQNRFTAAGHVSKRHKMAMMERPLEYPKRAAWCKWCKWHLTSSSTARVVRRSSADWPHARVVVANCFRSFRHV